MRVPIGIVGSKFHAGAIQALTRLKTGDELTLRPDPTNKYDTNAVEVRYEEQMLGFLPRWFSKHVAPQINGGEISRFAHFLDDTMIIISARVDANELQLVDPGELDPGEEALGEPW